MCQGCESNNHCGHNCHGCHVENGCLICGNEGLNVSYETVNSLAKPFIKEQLSEFVNEQFYLCTARACKVAYFTKSGAKIFLNQITVPVWFKHYKDQYVICYCRKITLDDIILAVKDLDGEITKEIVIKYLNKENIETDCLHHNPTGFSCEQLFNNAIMHALKQKEQ